MAVFQNSERERVDHEWQILTHRTGRSVEVSAMSGRPRTPGTRSIETGAGGTAFAGLRSQFCRAAEQENQHQLAREADDYRSRSIKVSRSDLRGQVTA